MGAAQVVINTTKSKLQAITRSKVGENNANLASKVALEKDMEEEEKFNFDDLARISDHNISIKQRL